MKTVEVVAAAIFEGDRVLCVQRGPNEKAYISKKWEFPGGKIEAGESHETALAREIREELKLQIHVGEHLVSVDHRYEHFRLVMHVYSCHALSGPLQLTEHLDHRWLRPAEMNDLDWAAADVPVVKALQGLENSGQ